MRANWYRPEFRVGTADSGITHLISLKILFYNHRKASVFISGLPVS